MSDDIAARFRKDTAGHVMTVLHDDGLYRHLRFMQPRPGSSCYWFELITVPNALIFRGDGESFVFSRLEDMFVFFRSGIRKDGSIEINPGYWDEKLTSDRDCVQRYEQDRFERTVKEWTVDAIRDGSAPRGIGKAVREDILDDWELGDETAARHLLDRFEFKGFRFHDAWECSFRDYDWWFLWACHGICWGIQQYDVAKAAGLASPVTDVRIVPVAPCSWQVRFTRAGRPESSPPLASAALAEAWIAKQGLRSGGAE